MACWRCLTEDERRCHWGQCVRCGAKYFGVGEFEGWAIGCLDDPVVCPSCLTPMEHIEIARAVVDEVERGVRAAEAEGRKYPAKLLRVAKDEIVHLVQLRRELHGLSQSPPSQEGEGS